MRKLLIVPVVIAVTSLSGSASAQNLTGLIGLGNPTTAIGSSVSNFASPVIQINLGIVTQVGVLSGPQHAAVSQNAGAILGIGNIIEGALAQQ